MKKKYGSKLALDGGKSLRSEPWLSWPRADMHTEKNLVDVLYSGRWAISGMYNGRPTYEQKFAEAFAEFNNIDFCTPVTNGSGALTVALEALGVGYGDEVLVPGITWVACASSVLRVGGVPVLVDVDPNTLAMSIESARSSITKRTKVIMLVHLYCSFADLDEFIKLANEFGLSILEDCSHAHGAVWSGRRVGTLGRVGVFSMQDSKLLTCGEGGAVITNDQELHQAMQQLRADGRRYSDNPIYGRNALEKVGSVQGRNLCLSEFHSAILCDRLTHLDEENELRRQNALYLNSCLDQLRVVKQIDVPVNGEKNAYYHYCGRVDLEKFNKASINTICEALTAEIGLPFEEIYSPLNHNALYRPVFSKRISEDDLIRQRINPLMFQLPNCAVAANNHLTFPHRALLGTHKDMDTIVEAFEKVMQLSEQLLNRKRESK